MNNTLTTLLFCVLVSSCVTYVIPKSSLISQFQSIDSTNLITKKVSGPAYTNFEYLANPITRIICEDQNGQQKILNNSPSIEIRVTEIGGEKTHFYFDRILVTSSQLFGVRSRFAPFVDSQIDLSNIILIEIQDGRKKFEYIN